MSAKRMEATQETSNRRALPDLPESSSEFWEDAQVTRHTPVRIDVCETHTRTDWMKYEGYIDNKDGTISCDKCGWGTRLPGYYKVMNGKVVDLRRAGRV